MGGPDSSSSDMSSYAESLSTSPPNGDIHKRATRSSTAAAAAAAKDEVISNVSKVICMLCSLHTYVCMWE